MTTSSRELHIFISHSHKDNTFGIKLAEDLRGVIRDESAVWYDSRGGLNGGDIWWKEIKRELKQCNTFIVILSPSSVKSQWVEKEIDIAWARHVRRRMKIIPILYQQCRVPEDLQTIHTVSFLQPKGYEEAFRELNVALRLPKVSVDNKCVELYGSHRTHNIQNLVQNVEAAYREENWSCVIEKVNIIANQYPEAMLPSLYCMQGWAYYFEEQSDLAQNALGKGIKLINDPQKQLALLDACAAQFVSDGQWSKVLEHANEALQLDPHNSIWQMAKVDAIEKFHQYGHISSKEVPMHSYGEERVSNTIISDNGLLAEKFTNPKFDSKKDACSENRCLNESEIDQKLIDIEVQKMHLSLKREQIQLERELMDFTFGVPEKIANVFKDVDNATKAVFLRAFLLKMSSLEDEKESQKQAIYRLLGT